MTKFEIIRHIDDGAKFYLDFFGDAPHMDKINNGMYTTISPKDCEQGVRFIYDLRLEELDDNAAHHALANMKATGFPIWWGLYPLHSVRVRGLLFGEEFTPKPPVDGDEFYMAMLPNREPLAPRNGTEIRRVKTANEFILFADIANLVFENGYGDIHPENHYHWCTDGRMMAYIAYSEGEAVSVAAVLNHNGVCSLEFVTTLSEYRRRHFAEAASIAAINGAFENGAKIITLRAFDPARRLYEKLGFETYVC
jgi:ribosomal protein S18 acetylase RimI-like enzyme